MATFQDFSLIRTKVQKYATDFGFKDDSNAFYHLILDLILGLQDDEVEDSVTDSYYLEITGKTPGKDRGIDAVYIEEGNDVDEKPKVHLFNFKYTNDFKKITRHYPSSEIDKILSFLQDLMHKEEKILKETVNAFLYSKVEEIWSIFERNPSFVIYLCGNCEQGLTEEERRRFEKKINEYSNFEIKYYLFKDLVDLIAKGRKRKVNAKLKAIDKNFFEKSDGDLRALIADIDARELIRVVVDDDIIRNNTDLTDYDDLKNYGILEDTFEDNVRVYLKRSKINRNIKKTALSDESYRFFYFNNGITITCDKFTYLKGVRTPTIELENIQVVNGGQTIHALYEAFVEDSSKFVDIEILCRIYETKNSILSTSIAEYTNSQNPVGSRDVRSIDFVQQKLEKEFLAIEYYYERKRNQYVEKPKHLRLDAEKAGQVLMSFYNGMPLEAKNRKRFIFGERYEEIFNNDINAEKVLLPYQLFDKIEEEKRRIKSDNLLYKEKYYILYSSYYILYILGELARKQSIELILSNISRIQDLYSLALGILEKVIERERSLKHKDWSSDIAFLKTVQAKRLIDQQLSEV